MKTYVFGEILSTLKDETYVAYCYQGRERRGSIAFFNKNAILIISKDNYISSYEFNVNDYSNFELWAFIHEMVDDEYYEIREEALNRLFDIYCGLYNVIPKLQEYPFKTE